MNTAKPIDVSEYYIKRIAKGMEDYLWENLFKSLFDTLKDNSVINSKSDLINAIRAGQIYYLDGAFRSENKKFSNVIATELELLGARFKYGAYYLPKAQIPVDVLNIIGLTQARAAAKLSAIDKILAKYLTAVKIPLDLFIESTVNMAFKKLEKDILTEAIDKKVPVIELGLATPKNTVNPRKAKAVQEYFAKRNKERDKLNDKINKAKKEQKQAEKNADIKKFNELTDKISELTAKRDEFNLQTQANIPLLDVKIDDLAIDYRSKKIAEDYTYNMKYWIQKWEAKNIIKMREDIVDMYQKGARISTIQEYLEKRWKIARDKAKFLAENECGLVSATVQATMWQETGATKFVWRRSVSKEKRKLHKEYYNKTFEFANPPIIDEKLGIKGLPRQIWNCLPAEEPIVSPFNYERIYRRRYTGELTTLVTDTGYTLNTTPNHPILTDKGWVGAGSLKIGDKIAKVKDNFVFSTSKNPQNPVTTIGQLFDFFSVFLDLERVSTTAGDFHGDGMVDEQVEVINIKSDLFFDTKAVLDKKLIEFTFAKAKNSLIGIDFSEFSSFFKSLNIGGFIPEGIISIFDKMLTLIDREFTHSNQTSFLAITRIYTLFLQAFRNSTSCDFEMFCKSLNTPAFQKQTLYRFIWELYILVSTSFVVDEAMPVLSKKGTKLNSINAEFLSDVAQIQTLDIEFDTIVDKFSSKFDSHIYNLQNVNNWYLYHNYIIKNCKCQMSVVVPSIDEIMEARKRNKNVIRRITNAIKDSTQCDNNPWRYRRFGQGQTL